MNESSMRVLSKFDQSTQSVNRVKVLLVDDRPDKRLAISSVLDDLDIEIIMAQSGRDALRMVLIHDFAVILLDVSMPIMDGFETASLIRQRKQTECLPIIFVTAFIDTDGQVFRGYALGAVDYIYAPVNSIILRAKVSVFIDLYRKNSEIKRQAEVIKNESEHRVASLENRLDGLLSRLHVGVYRLTIDGILVSANASFLLFFGIDPLSLNKAINFTDNYLDEASRVDFYKGLLGTGQALDYPVCQRHPDGTDRWISLSKTTVIESNGIRYIDGLAEDVTLRKKTEEELIAKAEELARSNAELEEFAYVASHDLQEPLRTISSYASLLVHRYAPLLDEKGKSFLGHLTESSLHMQNLIRDILAFSKIGKQLTAVQVNCNDILDRVIFNSEEGIAASGATISRDPLPTVIGDPVLLGQIFQNLFSNALKFRHKERSLHVHIGVEQQGVFWLFSVIDNGIGIPAQHYDKIFSIFNQLHTHDEYAGTGIGLAICRKAIQQFGGSISVDSELGSGSAFRFLLPCTA